MPLADWNLLSTWQAFYGARVGGASVTYGRGWAYAEADGHDPEDSHLATRRDRLIALGIVPADRILIAGCGYGYLIERFKAAGYPLVWGIDSSSHIAANRGIEAIGDTLFVEDDIRGGGRVRAALRQMTGDDEFAWVISDSVLESYTDAEIPGLLNAAETVLATGRPLSSIVHVVYVPPGFRPQVAGMVNEKTIDEWNAMRPAHTWMSDTGEVR